MLIAAIAISALCFGRFAVIQYFKNAPGLRSQSRIMRRQVEQDFLPVFGRIQRADQDDFFRIRRLASIYLVWNETACPECPEQVVYDSALFGGISKHITKTAATIGFLDQFAGKQIPVVQRFGRQYVKADFSH